MSLVLACRAAAGGAFVISSYHGWVIVAAVLQPPFFSFSKCQDNNCRLSKHSSPPVKDSQPLKRASSKRGMPVPHTLTWTKFSVLMDGGPGIIQNLTLGTAEYAHEAKTWLVNLCHSTRCRPRAEQCTTLEI